MSKNFGLRKINLATGTSQQINLNGLPNPFNAYYVSRHSLNFLLLSTNRGLYKVNEKSGKASLFSSKMQKILGESKLVRKTLLNPNREGFIALTNKGLFWLDSQGNIQNHVGNTPEKMVGAKLISQRATKLPNNNIKDIIQLDSTTYMVATIHGIGIFDIQKKLYQPNYLSDSLPELKNTVCLTIKEALGYYWVGTWGRGILGLKINPNTYALEDYILLNTSNGLPHNVVTNIEQASHQSIWVATLDGLVLINPFKPKKNLQLTQQDGLNGTETHSNNFASTSNGYLVVGSTMGLSVLKPLALLKNHNPGKVIFEKLEFLNKPIDHQNTFNWIIPKDGEKLVLPQDENSIRITYFANNLFYGNIRYEYKTNTDTTWNTTNERSLIFANLAPGDHIISIRPTLPPIFVEKNKTYPATHLSITILKPWWQRWYSIIGFLVGTVLFLGPLLLLVKGHYEAQQRKLKNQMKLQIKALESQKELLAQQNEIENKNHELELTQKELKRTNGEINQVISILSHDLRSPLTTLKGFVNMAPNILAQNNETENLRLFRKFSISVGNALSLIDNMLFWSRGIEKNLQVTPEMVDLHRIIFSSISLHQFTAEDKKISIEYLPLRGIWVYSDPTMLHIVFRNLISNGLKFTPQGGKITIDLELEKDHVYVKITDTGIGMEREKIKEIYSSNKVISQRGTNSEKGTGLGLPVCINFIRRSQGRIHIKSELGKGTTVTVKLPLRHQAATPTTTAQ